MIKAPLVGFAMMLITICSYSQMGFGVKAGYNNSTIKTDTSEYNSVGRRGSFNIGIFLNFPVNDFLSLQTDVMFNGCGAWTLTDRELGTASAPQHEFYERKLSLNYLSIPVMLKGSYQALNVQVGPQISILGRALVKEYYIRQEGAIVTAGEKVRDVQQYYTFFDFGFNAGIGVEVGRFQFVTRYSLGLSNISKNGGSVKNNVIQASVGFRLSEDY
jgi:hypothetical protein